MRRKQRRSRQLLAPAGQLRVEGKRVRIRAAGDAIRLCCAEHLALALLAFLRLPVYSVIVSFDVEQQPLHKTAPHLRHARRLCGSADHLSSGADQGNPDVDAPARARFIGLALLDLQNRLTDRHDACSELFMANVFSCILP